MRILIVQTAFLGDVVLTLPLLQALRRHVPEARIDLLTTPGNAPVLQGQPGLSAVLTYDKRGTQRGPRGFMHIVRHLRRQRYDIALSPHRSLRSALLLACSGIPRRIGFARALTNWAYTHTVERPASGHEVEKNLRLLTPLTYSDVGFCSTGAPLTHPSPPHPNPLPQGGEGTLKERGEGTWREEGGGTMREGGEGTMREGGEGTWREGDEGKLEEPGQFVIHVPAAARQRARDTLARHGIQPGQTLVGLIPGSQWGTKRWPAEYFAQLIDLLARRAQVGVALFGGPQDRRIAETIRAGCRTPVADLIGQTPLQDLAAFLDCCTLVVSNDTGPMHLAAALRKPVVVLYGPTTPDLGFYPYGTTWQEASVTLPCRPCHAHGPQRCPLGHWRCMRGLSPEQVAAQVCQLLGPCGGKTLTPALSRWRLLRKLQRGEGGHNI